MDSTLLLIIGIVGVIGFGVLGFAAFRMMGEEKAGKKDDYKFGEAPPTAESRAALPGAHEVLRVLRDDLTGRLIVEIGGQRFNRVMEIQDSNIGRGLMTTVRDLQKFMQGQATGSAPEPLAPAAVPAPPPATEPPPPRAPTPQAPRPSGAAHAAPPPPLAVPSMNPFKQAQVLRELNKQKPPEPKSIPEQIDEVLQEKIAGSPFVRRGLKVRLGPAGGVLFMLDGQGYEGVDAVPDPEVQTAIRAAVKEWESRQ